MKDFLQELLDYSFQMNESLIKRSRENEDHVSSRAITLFSHILNAQEIWNARIENRNPEYQVWDIHVLPAWYEMNRSVYLASCNILSKENLDRSVSYSNSKGETFTNSVRDIIYHLVNHSSYHRAQIATEFVNHGVKPIISDYIHHKRTQ